MLRRFFAVLFVVVVVTQATAVNETLIEASPADEYSGPYFGENNFPPGCTRDMALDNPDNICHHMRTDLNGLDSPQVDVLVMVPVSPTAERDMRIMRQSVEMWEAGIDYLAGQMDLDWLAAGTDFHITVDYIDPAGDNGGEFTTYPVVDPEIVVIATNPAGGIGIGVDPVDFVFADENLVPCHNVQNPFDFEYWDSLPGFDSHHDARSGTYKEDCGGAGGNICFAVNGAIDPAPEHLDLFSLFDLVAHEFGHCLTIGHVGDGAEGKWGVVPTNDIMAYSSDPPGLTKCVSTLDVESVAIRLSNYLDVNGDGAVTTADTLVANDQIGERGNPFQVQHPNDHLYASSTGSPMDCPQPDLGLLPSERTQWTPTPVTTSEPTATITAPQDDLVVKRGALTVSGTVEHVRLQADPTASSGSDDDPDSDGDNLTEILDFSVAVTATHIDATIRLAEIWPTTSVISPVSYSLVIDGRKFDSFVRYPHEPNPKTWDDGAGAYMPAGTSSWNVDANTVSFHIPRAYLGGIRSPYYMRAEANTGVLTNATVEDTSPDGSQGIGVAGPALPGRELPDTTTTETAVDFERATGNTFTSDDSSFGADRGTGHDFSLDVPKRSDVEFVMTWSDSDNGTDLDVYVTGAANSGSSGATANPSEQFLLQDVQGALDIHVEPYFIASPESIYTLTATIKPPDLDDDGVVDPNDVCRDVAGNGADGCPIVATERVHLYVDGVLVESQDVDTVNGADQFAIPVELAEGSHELRIEWEDGGTVIDSDAVTVTVTRSNGAVRRREPPPASTG